MHLHVGAIASKVGLNSWQCEPHNSDNREPKSTRHIRPHFISIHRLTSMSSPFRIHFLEQTEKPNKVLLLCWRNADQMSWGLALNPLGSRSEQWGLGCSHTQMQWIGLVSSLHVSHILCVYIYYNNIMYYIITSSAAQGGGGSFKNREPTGEIGCCESRMAERIHWWTERWLELCFLEWLQWLQWSPGRSPHPQLLDVVWCSAAVVVVVV